MSDWPESMRESVMYVDRKSLEEGASLPQGFLPEANEWYERILSNHAYAPRFELEEDPTRKQPIPYVVVYGKNGIFCLARKSSQGEARLHGKLSIGVGGHISEDSECGEIDAIRAGMWRELHEELHINDGKIVSFWGLLNDDSNEVGRVHVGLVFGINVLDDHVSVKETDKMEGFWASYEELVSQSARLESWSQLILPHLNERMGA